MSSRHGKWIGVVAGCAGLACVGLACGSSDVVDLGNVNVPEASVEGPGPQVVNQGASKPMQIPEEPRGGGVSPSTANPVDSCVGATYALPVGQPQAADILVVVENSFGLRGAIDGTRDQLNGLVARLEAAGQDPRVIVVSCGKDDCNDHQAYGVCVPPPLGAAGACESRRELSDSNPPRYLHVERRVSSRRSLLSVVESYSEWQHMVRPASKKHFVVVSAGASDWGTGTIATAMGVMGFGIGDYQVHAIVPQQSREAACRESPLSFCCLSAPSSSELLSMKDLVTSIGGASFDLCKSDISPGFDAISDSITQGTSTPCAWELPKPPGEKSVDPDKINIVVTNASDGATTLGYASSEADCASVDHAWYYEDPSNPSSIRVCPQTCSWLQEPSAAKVDVRYGCATQIVHLR